jgi:hypothetical protein
MSEKRTDDERKMIKKMNPAMIEKTRKKKKKKKKMTRPTAFDQKMTGNVHK